MTAPESASAAPAGADDPTPQSVRVRFWASARAAAGTPELVLPLTGAASLADLRRLVVEQLDGRPGLARVLEVCTVLVGDDPVHDDTTTVTPGATVEFLPPFAGG